jgi:hypothetical protein
VAIFFSDFAFRSIVENVHLHFFNQLLWRQILGKYIIIHIRKCIPSAAQNTFWVNLYIIIHILFMYLYSVYQPAIYLHLSQIHLERILWD